MPWPRRPLLIGAGALGSVALAITASDWAAASLYAHWKPQLEHTLSKQLGQPLRLGNYRGLRPWGIRIGPSTIAAQGSSRSSITTRTIDAVLAPLASLRQATPNVEIRLGATTATLVANRQGAYWTLPHGVVRQRPQRLTLQLRLTQPAKVLLPARGRRYSLSATTTLRFQSQALRFNGVLRPAEAGANGSLQLSAQGQWQQRRWSLGLALRQLEINALTAWLPNQQAPPLPGRLGGDLLLRTSPNAGGTCRGQLKLEGLLWLDRQGRPERGLQQARLSCQLQTLKLHPTALRWGPWQARLSGQARLLPSGGLQLETLALQRGRSWIRSRGRLGPTPELHSQLRIHPRDLPGGAAAPAWLQHTTLEGNLSSGGSWRQPLLRLALSSPGDPVLGPWRAALSWSKNQLQLQELRSNHLQARGTLPLGLQQGRGLVSGPLQLDLTLERFPLQRLQPLLGAQLSGLLAAQGTIAGPLQALVPQLSLQLTDLGAGPLQLNERWQGQWQGTAVGGGSLQMQALAPAPAGSLEAKLNRAWMPERITLARGQGRLSLQGRPKAYRWQAQDLLLNGVSLRLGPRGLPQPLRGLLSGQGDLSLQPLAFGGSASIERPALLGLRLQRSSLAGEYRNERYRLKAHISPQGQGSLNLDAQGRWRGPFALKAEARGLGETFLLELTDVWPQWQGLPNKPSGVAGDLGTLVISTLGSSLQQQLEALDLARARLVASGRDGSLQGQPLLKRLQQLQARVDADLSLKGPTLGQAQLDLAAKGHLWLSSDSNAEDQVLSQQPFLTRWQGPLSQGSGNFSIEQVPLALLALLTPVPEGLRGGLSMRGSYRLGRRQPELTVQLGLDGAQLAGRSLQLKRGSVELQDQRLKLDLALLAEGASSSIDLAGVLPLDPDQNQLELRLASRSDGLRFLAELAEPGLVWKKGSADLQLLLRGSVREPIANGFLRIREGEITLIRQNVRAIEATVVFDFEQLLIQDLQAQVGRDGRISAAGHLGLIDPTTTEPPLAVDLIKVPFQLPRIQAQANGRLTITGSLRDLQMGGEVAIDQGTINAQRGRLEPLQTARGPQAPRKSVSQLLQERWTFQEPVLLVGSEAETNSSQDVLNAVPRFQPLGFNDLRLRLGPNLKIVIPNAASFKTAGLLRLTGRLDPSLRARGVVRLLQGRLNLFTTTFSLDPDAPNVAVFTPALGLVPYLDIALRTRVSDTLAVSGLGSAGSPSLAEIEAQGGLTSLNQLNLVRITVSVSGPADRLAQNIRLRSSPPLPESRLIALIGGNSLAGLSGAGAGAAIATVVGQTLLSPVLGGISDAFGQRLTFALYPTYLYPKVTNEEALQSRRLAPQLVLGSELGLDVTERFNVSLLAAPNRSDVPQQVNLNVRATDLLNLQGSVDTQGAWQTQLQLFFRF